VDQRSGQPLNPPIGRGCRAVFTSTMVRPPLLAQINYYNAADSNAHYYTIGK